MNLWRIEEGKLRLAFHPGQARAWQSDRRFTFVFAGTQGGKTSLGPWWLWKQLRRFGAGDYLAVTSAYDLLKLKMLPELRTVFEHVLKIGRYWSGDKLLEIADNEGHFWANRADDPMFARIILRSAASGGGLESSTANAAWLDECGQDTFGVETWEAVLRRLSLSQGPVLGTTTLYNLGWLKSAVYDAWTGGDPDFGVIQFNSAVNPAFPEAEEERARRTMPMWRYQMAYQGQFSRPAGLIYELDELHVAEPFLLPSDWPRYCGIDFGGVNTVLVWLAHDQSADRYFVYRESLEGSLSTREHAAKAKALAQGSNLVRAWGGAASEDQWRTDWGQAGFPISRPPVADVEAGIERVTALLRERKLFIFRDCRGLLDEFGTYRRKLDASGQPTEEIEAKRTFHRLDALRYLCSGLRGGQPYAMPATVVGPSKGYSGGPLSGLGGTGRPPLLGGGYRNGGW